MSPPNDEESSPVIETPKDEIVRINTNVDPRMFLLPAIGATTGLALGTSRFSKPYRALIHSHIGLFRGAGNAKLRYLAENTHKRPTTVRGWYFYNKTKNYQMMWAGLKEGGKEAVSISPKKEIGSGSKDLHTFIGEVGVDGVAVGGYRGSSQAVCALFGTREGARCWYRDCSNVQRHHTTQRTDGSQGDCLGWPHRWNNEPTTSWTE
jgi:hypothetical protein